MNKKLKYISPNNWNSVLQNEDYLKFCLNKLFETDNIKSFDEGFFLNCKDTFDNKGKLSEKQFKSLNKAIKLRYVKHLDSLFHTYNSQLKQFQINDIMNKITSILYSNFREHFVVDSWYTNELLVGVDSPLMICPICNIKYSAHTFASYYNTTLSTEYIAQHNTMINAFMNKPISITNIHVLCDHCYQDILYIK